MISKLVTMGIFSLGLVSAVSAHISVDQGGTHKSRWQDFAQTKQAPCGVPLGPGRQHVYTYQPGETIDVTVREVVRHPGYFRIAFDNDGDDDFVDPRWITLPLPEGRGCPIPDSFDQCRAEGEGDFYNNDTVLLDNLNEHQGLTGSPKDYIPRDYTWKVTLPDVECENCTLQIIQVMKDPSAAHGPYNTTDHDDGNDVYHQCIDLRLQNRSSGENAAVGDGGMVVPPK